jgi:molybdenum cofactor cytidylyltransferase
MTDADLPLYGAEQVGDILEEDGPERGTPRAAGVLLAGGTSSRFGEANKLLAELDGEPVVRHAARTLLDAGLAEVVAVLGYEADAVGEALAGLPLRAVENPDYREGMAASVRRGTAAAADVGADAVVFLPGDMPAVEPGTVDSLVEAYQSGLGTALAAAHEGQRGNPVLFDRDHFEALLRVEGDTGGRSVLLDSDGAGLVETGDPGVRADVDTREELRRHRGGDGPG